VDARRLGTRWSLNLADNVQRTLYLTGTYEPELLGLLRAELRSGDTYVDVGGHIGIHARVAAQQVGRGDVYAFEPAPDSAAAIRRAVADLANVTVVETALGGTTGTVDLRADPMFGGQDAATRSLLNDGEVVCSVPITTFDAWAGALPRMDLVKIDVEGYEYHVLRGMRHSLARLRPRLIVMELEPRRLARAGHTAEELVAMLDASGYRATRRIGSNTVFARAGIGGAS
jgi:FkbM family methyltransferase